MASTEQTQRDPQAKEPPFRRIAIAGMGLIGASLAAALRQACPGIALFGADIDERSCAEAQARGWVDQAGSPYEPAFKEFVMQPCDLVVVATPVDAAESILRLLAEWDFPGVITDTASTKAHLSQVASQLLPHPQNYVPGHPMAGSEVNGIDGARPDLFKGAYWILCPDEATPPEHFARLHELVTGMAARVIALRREDHDQSIAIVSHVPHFIASSLMQLASRHADKDRSLMRLAAGGFKDSTRIAAGSPELWCGIAFDNAEAIRAGLQEVVGIITAFSDALAAGDRATFTKLLSDAAEARRALPAAWVPSTEDLLEVRIPMEDRRGVVAEVTTIASAAGCNIQSIEIDHITEDSAVLSLVLTDEGDVGKLSASLIKAGFSVSFSPLSAKEHSHV